MLEIDNFGPQVLLNPESIHSSTVCNLRLCQRLLAEDAFDICCIDSAAAAHSKLENGVPEKWNGRGS